MTPGDELGIADSGLNGLLIENDRLDPSFLWQSTNDYPVYLYDRLICCCKICYENAWLNEQSCALLPRWWSGIREADLPQSCIPRPVVCGDIATILHQRVSRSGRAAVEDTGQGRIACRAIGYKVLLAVRKIDAKIHGHVVGEIELQAVAREWTVAVVTVGEVIAIMSVVVAADAGLEKVEVAGTPTGYV